MAVKAHWKTTSGDLDKALKQLRQTRQPELLVGVLKGSAYGDGLLVAQVAYWMEYGTATVPARAFFRITIDAKREQWVRDTIAYIKHKGLVNNPDVVVKAFDALGQQARDDLKFTISKTSILPRLAASTVAAKTRQGIAEPEHTLVWSGALLRELKYSVDPNGGTK